MLPVYLEEINSTLPSAAYKLSHAHVSAAELTRLGFQAVESGMTEGHPGFVANNGRIGFDIEEFHHYAPEAASPVHLVWLAAHRERTVFTSYSDINYATLIEQELGGAQRGRFEVMLTDLGLDPAHYFFPVHPWQWTNRISLTSAGKVATRKLVHLGRGEGAYLPQQSIRTFFNADRPERRYVKTVLSVLNMGFMRGLSAAYMEATPAINAWLADLIAGDPVLRGTGLTILREQATIGYRHPQYEVATDRFPPIARCSPLCNARVRHPLSLPVSAWRPRPPCCTRTATEDPSPSPSSPPPLWPPGVAAPLPGRLPHSAAAQLVRARPGVHTPRQEREPGPGRGRDRGQGSVQGHY